MNYDNFKSGWKPNPDPERRRYPMTLELYEGIERDLPATTMWDLGPILNQKNTPKCVAYAWKQWQQTTPLRTLDGPAPEAIYTQVKKLDGHPQEDGSSTEWGLKAMTQEGRIQTALWAFDSVTLKHWVLTKGPVVVGAGWYDSMFTPDEDYFVTPRGKLVGGHEFLCYGYDGPTNSFKFVNSWGESWGDKGTFWMKANDVITVIWGNPAIPGDACAAVERKVEPAPTFKELMLTKISKEIQ